MEVAEVDEESGLFFPAGGGRGGVVARRVDKVGEPCADDAVARLLAMGPPLRRGDAKEDLKMERKVENSFVRTR